MDSKRIELWVYELSILMLLMMELLGGVESEKTRDRVDPARKRNGMRVGVGMKEEDLLAR